MTTAADVRIVVLQRGWVAIGHYHRQGEEIRLTNASIVRRWGTSKGLGELRDGPTASTQLDPIGTLRAHELTVVFDVEVDGTAWEGKLPS